jgi:DNA-binding NtrC family response regulator
MEKKHIQDAVELSGRNIDRASSLLGINRKELEELIKKHE